MVQFTFEQVLSIQAEQVTGKSVDTETTTSQFSKAMPENNLLEDSLFVVGKIRQIQRNRHNVSQTIVNK